MRNLISVIILLSLSSLLNSAPGDLLWKYKTGAGVFSSPCVSDGVVYVGSEDYYLYAVYSSDGSPKWRFRTGYEVHSSPCVSDGVVYVGSLDTYLYAINCSDRTLKWRYKTDGGVNSSPCVSDGVAYVGSRDHYLYAINCTDGTLKWRYKTGEQIYSSPCVSDGVVYIGTYYDGCLCAISCSDGSLKWRYQTDDYIQSSPCVSDGVVFIGSYDKHLYAIEAYKDGFKDNKSTSYIPARPFSAIPNPFSSHLSVSLSSSASIYSLTGQLIMNLSKGKHSLDTSKWREGVYIVKSGKECKRVVKVK